MKKLVLINEDFKDVYTDEMHNAGEKEVMTDVRIAEIKAVNPNFVTVIGAAEDEVDEEKEALKAELEAAKAEAEKAKADAEKAKADLKKAKAESK